MAEEKVLTAQEQQDLKDAKKFRFFYPFSEFCAGIQKSFFGTYLNFMYTNVYMFTVTYTAIMTVCSNLVSWIVTPVFSGVVDKIKFKKAKYYPLLAVGAVVSLGIQFLITGLPFLTGQTTSLAPFVFGLAILQVVVGPLLTSPVNGSFPRMGSKSTEDRLFLAKGQKFGRDGGKTIFGYVVPVLLATFSGSADGSYNMRGYALTGLVAALVTIMGYELFAFCGLKDSFVEREALAETEKMKAAKVPFSQTIKVLVANRPMLGSFLFMLFHKSYYFLYTSYATYQFTYVFRNPAALGSFFTVFNLLAIIGVLFGGVYQKIFKDSKRAFVACYITHMIFLVIIALFFNKMSATAFIAVFGCSSFFMGMLETWVLPSFAASAEYGAWVSGNRMDSLVMSFYSLSVVGSLLVTTLVGSTLLNSFDYSGWLVKYQAGEVGITDEVVSGLSIIWTWAPLILSCCALCSLLFVYNLNDKRIAAVQKDLAEGKTKANSTIDWKSL